MNDLRQRFSFSSLYELPVGHGKRWLGSGNRFVNGFLGGWEVTTVLSLQTGFPITPQSGFDFANVGTGNWRPDRICNGALPAGQRTIQRWFDTSCFTDDLLQADYNKGIYRFGNSGRSVLDGPGFQDLDVGMIKDFHISESKTLQFRAEFFNALNHANFHADRVDTNVQDKATGRFGTVTGAYDPRDIQIALKFLF